MADEPRAEKQNAEEQTQQEPVPSSEEKLPSSPESAGDAAKQQEAPAASSKDGELELPDGVRHRTREQFEKLKAQNRELRDLVNELAAAQAQAQAQPQQPVSQGGFEKYLDPVTGEVDVGAITRDIEEAKRKAETAVKTIQEKEAERQEQEAYEAYPELNPQSKEVDKEFFKRTRAVLMDSIINPKDYGGKPLTLKQAADLVKGVERKAAAQGEKAGAEKAITQLTPKEQASLEATGRSDRRREVSSDTSELSKRSRQGDYTAVAERLKRLGL